jgi:spore coat polysaccharide biosynthesis predicted glycosyltransferase SpsG
MAATDMALCAGGTTSLELASLGVPMVLVTVADNQEPGAVALDCAGCARLAGRGGAALPDAVKATDDLLHNPAAREDMGRASAVLVDGRGVTRIARALG